MRARLVLGGVVAVAVALGVVAVAAARGAGGPAPRATPARPNVLVIVTDDARAETLQAMPKTRRWIADAGVTFTQGFATTPSCCPSRASSFSGRYVHNHGVLRQQLGDRLDQTTTLASELRDAGYATAMAGTFLNRWPLERPPPGFDAPGIRDWAALRTPTWQYIENYDQPGGTFREFYDLVRDPGMDPNLLADDDPGNDPPASIAAELAAARTCAGAGCP
jgi:arylsulfatase A-like enzyme